MSTYGELVYFILDELKLTSDDSHFQREHVIFLLDKYRLFILKQRYSDIKKEIPESNFQTICVNLEPTEAFEGDPCSGTYLRSVEQIPQLLSLKTPVVSTMDYFSGNLNYVNRERFKYAGSSSYLKNMIYSTIAPDEHLYLKSSNPQYLYLEKAKVTGIFEDSAKASELQCPDENGNIKCDLLDREFPLEEALIPTIIELIIKELSSAKYTPKDEENNASDDLADIAGYIRQNMRQDFLRRMDR